MDIVDKAKEIATNCHKGQYRKDGETHYITHPEAVVEILKLIGVNDKDILCSAWLHDVLEDCDITKEEITNEINEHVAEIVSQLTRDVDRDEYKERIKKAEYAVQIIKLADTVHNCSQLNDSIAEKTIKNKVKDVKAFYLDLAEKICPRFKELFLKYLKPWWDLY